MMMMKGSTKVESLILLSAVFIYLIIPTSNTFAVAAPPPPPPAAPATASTVSTSASNGGVLSPSSKMSAGSASINSNHEGTQPDSGKQLHKQPERQSSSSATVPLEHNEIAHHNNQQGEDAAAAAADATTTSTLHGKETFNGEGGEGSKVISGQRASFVNFPPYNKPAASQTRYQRQRRSYPMPSLLPQDYASSGPSYKFTRPDELELRLDDDRDREAFLKLMSLLATENNNRLIGDSSRGNRLLNDDLSSLFLKSEDDEIPDERDNGDEDEIDLGAFQRPVGNPYYTSGSRSNEPINLMSSLLASDSPRMGSPHGLYGMGDRTGLGFEMGLSPRARNEDETDGEWLEDSVPLHGSHFKTRRSGNNEFTFNPVKSHFRRYLRAVPLKSGRGLEFVPSGGRFGPIVERRRRATFAGNPAVRWM